MVPQQAVIINGFIVILMYYGTGPSLGKIDVYIYKAFMVVEIYFLKIYLKHLFVNLRIHSHCSPMKKIYLLSITYNTL